MKKSHGRQKQNQRIKRSKKAIHKRLTDSGEREYSLWTKKRRMDGFLDDLNEGNGEDSR